MSANCPKCGREMSPTDYNSIERRVGGRFWKCVPCDKAEFESIYKPTPFVCNTCGSSSTKTASALYFCTTCSERRTEKAHQELRLNSPRRCKGCGVGIGNPRSFEHRNNLCGPCRDKYDQSQNKGFWGGLFG